MGLVSLIKLCYAQKYWGLDGAELEIYSKLVDAKSCIAWKFESRKMNLDKYDSLMIEARRLTKEYSGSQKEFFEKKIDSI